MNDSINIKINFSFILGFANFKSKATILSRESKTFPKLQNSFHKSNKCFNNYFNFIKLAEFLRVSVWLIKEFFPKQPKILEGLDRQVLLIWKINTVSVVWQVLTFWGIFKTSLEFESLRPQNFCENFYHTKTKVKQKNKENRADLEIEAFQMIDPILSWEFLEKVKILSEMQILKNCDNWARKWKMFLNSKKKSFWLK